MDYFFLAEKMLSVRARLSHLPAGEAVSDACGGEFFALSLLLLDDAPGCPSGLRRSMGVSSARIAALLKHLEQKGWISRSADEHDERRVNVSLTDGRARAYKQPPPRGDRARRGGTALARRGGCARIRPASAENARRAFRRYLRLTRAHTVSASDHCCDARQLRYRADAINISAEALKRLQKSKE